MNDASPVADTAGRQSRPLLIRVLGIFSGTALTVLMLVTVVDVIGRTASGMSVIGAYELSELTIGIIVALGMPLVALNSSHLAIDMLQPLFKGWFLSLQQVSVRVVTGAAELFLAWCLYAQALRAAQVERVTSMLQIPVAPVLFILAALLAFAGVITFVLLLRRRYSLMGKQ